ncbi:MAG TPA: hypothetical protein VJX73_10075 [Terracidiphilus sp.]|nr:hypothetical protein [Terracidiphilus sp.]
MTDRSVSNAEGWAVLGFSMAASFAAIIWSWNHAAMLNYGDAVAHLHIARRVFDSRTARLSELGSVWLPLPHILLIPFVQNYAWWANGLAGVIPSASAYIASCAGIYRLARQWLNPAPSALALVFFALNPNLLYLQTTAMTEPLFLCETIWIVVWMVEWRAALHDEFEATSYRLPSRPVSPSPAQGFNAPRDWLPLRIFEAGPRPRGAWLQNPELHSMPRKRAFSTSSSRMQVCVAAAVIAAIFTRYDGWIIALIAWTGIGLARLRYGSLRSRSFWVATIAVAAAPILWFVYNSVCFGDWLYFARGPFSAKAIELRTAAPGAWPPHPGWHNPWVALLFYLKVSELDSVLAPAWSSFWGNLVLTVAALGSVAAWFAEKAASHRRALAWALLLWLPVPFYTWSIAYGSVPIFFPAWWPFTFYNTRYGIELLPALALGLGFAASSAAVALKRWQGPRIAQLLPDIAFALLFVLVGVNVAGLLRQEPIVYAESTTNLDARLPYDQAIPPLLQDLLSTFPRGTLLMNTSTYPEIVAFTGIPLRQTINESDLALWRVALEAPASHAAIVVAFDGDEVDRAIKARPEGFDVAGHFTAENQPSATVYSSTAVFHRSRQPKLGAPDSGLGTPGSDTGKPNPF